MSFFGGLKRALGWSSDDDDEDYITYGSSTEETVVSTPEKNNVVEFCDNDEIPEGIFDGLVDIINANLSPMVLKCLDVEAEKKYLYEALGPKFKDFVKSAKENGLALARDEWAREKGELNGKIEDFKARCESAENDMKEMKAMKMSEERQKLALKERIRNLEDQVATAEAEKEQYDLENKSLLNKLKVSQVKSEANEEAEKEIQELTAQIVALKKKLAEGGSDDEKVKQIEDEFNAKMEINNALLNEIRAEAAKNKEELATVTAELENVKSERDEAVASADNVKADLDSANEELAKAKSELAEMSDNLSVLDDIQEQLDKVEEFKKKKEDEISALQEKIALLEQEKANVLERLQEEDVMRGRIAELELEISDSKEKVTALAQENTDTLALLHKKEEVVEQQKAEMESLSLELEKVKTEYSVLLATHESETNALKTADVEKTKKFQAEIAELQAKLNVNGNIDDALVEDDLRQAVEETFDVELDITEFDEFSVPVIEEKSLKDEILSDVEPIEEKESEESLSEDVESELDDIDWLMPDTVESAIKEEESKKAKMQEGEPAIVVEKEAEEPDMQMSLFG